jgi:hypothetical protein
MENGMGVKFMINGDLRKHSLEEEGSPPVLLLNGDASPVNDDEGSKSPTDKTVKEGHAPADRIKRKAKRLTNQVLAKDATNGQQVASRFLKNSRKPRNGFGRGLPKKGTNSSPEYQFSSFL